MAITTSFSRALGIKHPIIQGGMMFVGKAEMAAAVAGAGALGIITALTQPTPDALREEIKRTHKLLNGKEGKFGVNITLLPSITPPDYPAFARAAMDEGVTIFETAGNNPGPLIKYIQTYKAPGQSVAPKRFVIHKCTTIRHALSAQKLGVDCLSIDGFECAGHPGEEDIGGLVLLARAAKELKVPFVASGGFADGRGLASALALGAQGINMGTRFMCTVEAPIHQKIKQKIVDSTERDTIHIFRTLHNTARVFKNKVAEEVVRIENRPGGAKFEDIRELVAGARGKTVYETGDSDAGIWSAGIAIGLIDDIPTCEALCTKIVDDAEKVIAGLNSLVTPSRAAGKL
ncbi:hypothetical protein VHUM_00123 [Vanrija humicola]|uniref:Uncharacterized protein n=1 Tax=Vanrija humicola TaxID=5417 RepID=A0A7D8Z451_VANHU|nr:hypothetical protein VHUM_00123 [Vanrija humicola]